MDRNALAKVLAVNLLDFSGVGALLRPFYGGCGAVLALHRVLPEGTPVLEVGNVVGVAQLREILGFLKRKGWSFVSLDELPDRLRSGKSPKFMAITLDDGYLDNLAHGLPVFREFKAPFAVFPATGFVNRTVVYTPILTAELLGRVERLVLVHTSRGSIEYPAGTREEKLSSFQQIGWDFDNADAQAALTIAGETLGLSMLGMIDGNFLSWEQLRELASDPLVTIGVHTVNHVALAQLSEEQAVTEMQSARDELNARLGVPIRHIAYPFGSPGTCGEREFRLARELGFITGYTTRRGNLHPRHVNDLWSLPRHTLSMVRHSANVRYLRLSLNGIWDSPLNGTLFRR